MNLSTTYDDCSTGMFLTLQVTDKATAPVTLSIPLTFAEIAVIVRLMEFSIPYFLAFDLALSSSRAADMAAYDDLQSQPDEEWDQIKGKIA